MLFFFSSRRRHTRFDCDWSSDVCSSDLLRGRSTRFGRALDGISDNLRFVNLYFHLIYRLIHAGFWGPGAFLLVAAAGLAHTFQSAAIDFVRNAFLYIGVEIGRAHV